MRALALSMLVFCGCETGLADKQAELAALQRDEVKLAERLDQLTRQTTAVKNAVEAETGRTRRVVIGLREQQISAVARWRGDAKELAALKEKHPMPRDLEGALDLAQSVAGGETLELRFKRAVEKEELAALPGLLDGWERHWFDTWEPAPQPEPVAVCPTDRTLTCKPIDDDSLWCPDPQLSSAWAMLLENGTLTVAQLSNGADHVVEARLAPRVWLTRVGSADDGLLLLNVVRNSSFTTDWMSKLKHGAGRLESLRANFDEDPYTEAIFWADDGLSFIDPTSRDTVAVRHNEAACDELQRIEGVPRAVKERCLELLAPKVDGGSH